MKNYIFLLISLFGINSLFSQNKELTVLKKYTNDSLYIKWIPGSISSFQSFLNNETTIEWLEVDKNTNINSVVFTGKNKKVIKSFKSVNDSLVKLDENIFIMSSLFIDQSNQDPLQLSNSFINAIVQNFLDKKIADLTGNVITISGLKSNKFYAIEIKNKSLVEVCKIIIETREEKPLKIDEFDAFTNVKQVNLEWNNKYLKNNYCAFNVYKKNVKDKSFIKINEIPILGIENSVMENPDKIFQLDPNVKQGETYLYQIKAIDFFGDETGLSEIKKVYIPLEVNGAIQIDTIFAKETDRTISGSILSIDTLHPLNISEYVLLRSDSLTMGFKVLKSIKVTSFVDTFSFTLNDYRSGDQFYYKVCGISADKDSVFSVASYFFTYDQDPPGISTNLKGTIDSLGVMRLSWTGPSDNDIEGYRVFKGNFKGDEFGEITSQLLTVTAVTDTLPLNTLTNDIYYYVVAVDDNFNNSFSSDTILLVKPDTIAPVPSFFLQHDYSEKGVQLNWNNALNEDIVHHYLYRLDDKNKKTLITWYDTITKTYLDTNVQSGSSYQYQLVAEDKSLNKSFSEIYYVNFELGYRNSIQKVEARVDLENKNIVLNWVYNSSDVYSYQIYRSKENKPYILYETLVNSEKNELIDKSVNLNTNYSYKIIAVLKSGISTKMSKEVKITY